MPSASSTTSQIRFASALSGHLDPASAAEHVVERCTASLRGTTPDFAALFLSTHHLHAAPAILKIIRDKLAPANLIGCTAESVLGGSTEMEGIPAISLLAAHTPGVSITPFLSSAIPTARDDAPEDLDSVANVAAFGPDHRATLLIADPFSTPSLALLPTLARARNKAARPRSQDRRPAPIIGGFASSAPRPGGNLLILNDSVHNSGAVALSLSGNIRVDALVSQGCKPIGEPMIITAGKGQMISQLAGRPALRVLTEVLDALDTPQRAKLRRGLFIGRAINEYKDRFGRDDFIIRNVIGVEKQQEAVAVADLIRVGQTIQFHIRDAQSADEDLAMLLDAQRLYDTPEGILLFTCNGRGTRLFDKPHHDANAISAAFLPPTDAAALAKGGQPLASPTSPIPMAGFFCAGEIGPIGDEVFVHGQTASVALFRQGDAIL